jgi:hypothetical protein
MQKVVGSNPISRLPFQSQIRSRALRPVARWWPSASALVRSRLVVIVALGVERVEPTGDLGA